MRVMRVMQELTVRLLRSNTRRQNLAMQVALVCRNVLASQACPFFGVLALVSVQ